MHASFAQSDSKRAKATPNGAIPCAYCGLPVRIHRANFDSESIRDVYCCYGCRFAADITQARGEHGHATLVLTRLGIAVFLSMSVMIFSLYLYSREAYFTEADHASATADALTALMRYASLLFTGPVFVLLGFPLVASSIEQWRRGIASTDALVVLGVGAAFAFSLFNTLNNGDHTYYETVCMVLVLVTLGRWLEATAKLRASDAAKSLSGLLPDSVIVLRAGEQHTIPIDALQVDDHLHIPAGQRIVADGIVIGGTAGVDESIVTGESTSRRRTVGDAVIAGSTTVDGSLQIRATAVGAASTIGRIEAMLDAARREKSGYERLADRIASWFLPVTIMAAITVGAISAWVLNPETGLLRALALLLIACPCALGIATPTAVWAALGRAARMGALFANGAALERLGRIKAICFDKTGTLTTGMATVEAALTGVGTDDDEALAVSAGLAASSRHVVAQSIAQHVKQLGIPPAPMVDACMTAGKGVQATWGDTNVFLGSPTFMSESHLRFNAYLEAEVTAARHAGKSICCVGWSGMVRCVFFLQESIRPSATTALGALKGMAITPSVLTGDHALRGAQLAQQLSVDVRADLSPEAKTAALMAIRLQFGPVAMVGDGVNDSPALASADVGIALGCGADIARDAADVCLLGEDLGTIPTLIELSRQTLRTIRLNLFWAFAFNLVGMTLAATGQLTPIFAAIAMVLSSLLVVGNSLRLATVEENAVNQNNNEPKDGEPTTRPSQHILAGANPMPRSDGDVTPVCNRWEPSEQLLLARDKKSLVDERIERATS